MLLYVDMPSRYVKKMKQCGYKGKAGDQCQTFSSPDAQGEARCSMHKNRPAFWGRCKTGCGTRIRLTHNKTGLCGTCYKNVWTLNKIEQKSGKKMRINFSMKFSLT